MYSDMIESPSKDCFSFNDQSSPYDMAEVNEINNQTNLDYIFDSYYSSVSRYNTDFELSEDCKNMSFSELFDQELFSTHVSENKDCQITIKIEKEEPLNECFSADNSTDTTGSQSFEKAEDNFPSLSSLSKSFAPKRGINRTSIKTSKTSDVKHLIHNPFCETEQVNNQMLGNIYSPIIIKCEPEVVNDNVEENFVEIEINPYYSTDNVQNNANLEKCEDFVVSSMPSKSSTPKSLGINRISIKTPENCDVEHLNNSFCEPKDPGDHQISVKIQTPIIKCEPIDIDINNTIEDINVSLHYSADDSNNTFNSRNMNKVVDTYGTESTTNSHNMVKGINSVTPMILKKSTPKHLQINRTSIKTPKINDAKHFYNNFCESKDLGDDKISVKIQTPVIKCEPIDINDTIKVSNASFHYSADLKNTAYTRNMIKVKKNVIKYGHNMSQSTNNSNNMAKAIDSVTPSLLKNSSPKRQVNNKMSLKTTNNKLSMYSKTKHIGANQVPAKVNTPIVKSELEENDTIKKPIVKISRNFEDIVSSSLLKTSTTKRRANQTKYIKATDNSIIKNITHSEPKKSGNDQISERLKTPIIKQEPEDFNATNEECFEINPYYGLQNTSESQTLVKIDEIVLPSSPKGFSPQHRGVKNSSIKTTDNSDDKNQIIYNLSYEPKDLGNSITSAKVQMPIIKRETEYNSAFEVNVKIEKETKCIDHNNFHSADLITGNVENQKLIPENINTTVSPLKIEDIDSQTDKKKISWEEFRAKREKMGLINISEIKEEPVTDFVATDNLKMKAMKEEFDRNTAEHFTGQKRKIDDDKEEQTTIAKEINTEEEELQKKRMKIEYIKKLPPSSFASEIIKTSSLMKGTLVEDNDNESTSDDSIMSNDKTQGKYSNTRDRSQNKGYLSRVHSSHHNSSRSDYNNKSSRSSSISSNSDDYYNRSRTDAPLQGQYGQSARTTLQRPKEQKRVVYIGQIPIRLGKRYLYNRFKEFGTIQSLTLHKKPEFRVYYAFVTYSENSEADRAISHGNDDESQVQLDIRFGERKQTQTPYYDLDDEWLTDWYGYNQPLAPVVRAQSPEKVSYEKQLQEFYKLAQSKKSNQIKSSQVS